MRVKALSAYGTRTYSAWQPSMVQPRSQPPCSQLLTQPRRQKKHSPQKVSQFTATRSPGEKDLTPAPTSSTTPTNSWPSTVSGVARGTAPRMICRSLVQMVERVTRTMASAGPISRGRGRSRSAMLPRPSCTSAFISSPPKKHQPAPARMSVQNVFCWRRCATAIACWKLTSRDRSTHMVPVI